MDDCSNSLMMLFFERKHQSCTVKYFYNIKYKGRYISLESSKSRHIYISFSLSLLMIIHIATISVNVHPCFYEASFGANVVL